MIERPSGILKKYWGYDSFRPMQEEIISAALDGSDVLAILPTGGGKSICFQVPAMMKEGTALVVTPLIALMKDQVQNLESRGIKAICIHAGMTRKEIDLALNNAAYGNCKFLYVSPERLGTELFKSYLEVLRVNYIVVDEAHCISQWGYDFRPEYLQISAVREFIDAPVIALTATATSEVAKDITEKLSRGTDKFKVLKSGFERDNLTYIVRKCQDKRGQLLNICAGVKGSGIVYLRNRSACEDLSAFLNSNGISASYYHAGLGTAERARRQEAWKKGDIRVMVCTNAFGMGIDKPDVRFVAHTSLPDSLESYFQEAGRAGRDGKRSYAVLLWNEMDRRRLEQLQQLTFPTLDYIEDIYQKLHIFFGIPYGQGEGRSLNFNLEEFCKHFSFNRASVHYAVKYLASSGHLCYSEDVDIPTRVKIRVERGMLYDIDLPDQSMVDLLEALMRKYTGIFSYPVSIDEDNISATCGMSVTQLRQALYRLSLEHVINYIPCDHSNVILLYHNRLTPGNVDLNVKMYEFLKGSSRARMDAIAGYASQQTECRSVYLLKYFGQSESKECGHCDVCRSGSSLARTKKALRTFAQKNPGFSVESLKTYCEDPSSGLPPDAVSIYRKMLDDGEI